MRALAEGAEMSSRQTVPDADPLELLKIITLEQVTELTTLSADSLKRHHADKVRRLGPRRLGMRLGDALAIGEQCQGRYPQRHRDRRGQAEEGQKLGFQGTRLEAPRARGPTAEGDEPVREIRRGG